MKYASGLAVSLGGLSTAQIGLWQSVEWYQIHQTHGFQVFDAIPFAPFLALL